MTPDALSCTAGERVPLLLGPPPALGYVWELEPVDGVRLVHGPVDGPGAAPGSSTVLHLSLVADLPGSYDLTLRLARPWSRTAPVQVHAVHLTVH